MRADDDTLCGTRRRGLPLVASGLTALAAAVAFCSFRLAARADPATGLRFDASAVVLSVVVGDADSLPWILVAFLATVGDLALASAAVSVVQRHRDDLAVSRAMGFTRGNVRTAVTVQAVALTITGLAIGIPAGLIIGRFVRRWFANDLVVGVDVITPWPLIIAFAVASPTVFALFSLVPARTDARVRAAEVLRTE